MLLKNVKVEWAKLTQPDQLSGALQIDAFATQEDAKDVIDVIDKAWDDHKGKTNKAQSIGYTIQDDGMVKFRFKRNAEYKDGKKVKIPVYDAKASQFEHEDIPLIGNGSLCSIQFSIYPYVYQANKGLRLTLDGVQILDLIEYTGAPKSEFDVVEEASYDGASNKAIADETPKTVAGI